MEPRNNSFLSDGFLLLDRRAIALDSALPGRRRSERLVNHLADFYCEAERARLEVADGRASDVPIANSSLFGESGLHAGESADAREAEDDDVSFLHFDFPDLD